MSRCARCGVVYHPELTNCPLCGSMRSKERERRRRLGFLINTIAVSFVATVVLWRTAIAPDVQIGMSSTDCQSAQELVKQTRYAIESISSDQDRAVAELTAVSERWGELAGRYVPGKYSWSSTGHEHNWLERLSDSTYQLSVGGEVRVEEVDDPRQYVVELTKLYPRYCS